MRYNMSGKGSLIMQTTTLVSIVSLLLSIYLQAIDSPEICWRIFIISFGIYSLASIGATYYSYLAVTSSAPLYIYLISNIGFLFLTLFILIARYIVFLRRNQSS